MASTPKPALTPSRLSSSAVWSMPSSRPRRSPWRSANIIEILRDLGDQVEVGRQSGDGAVEEHHVLDVQHQLLGHPGAVAEQRLDDPLHLVDELLAGQRGRVDRRLVEAQVADDGVEVGVGAAARRGRAAPPSDPRTSLVVAASIIRRNASRRSPLSRPTMPKSSSAVRPSAQHEQVAAVQVAVEDAVDHRAFHEARSSRCAPRPRCRCPASFMPTTSSKLKPLRRSITSTRRVTSVGCGRGTT